jgi:hypothetical protein
MTTKLKSFDRTNTDDLARQLVLVAQFGEYLCSLPDKLEAESEKTFGEILSVLDTYCSELQRLLDGKPLEESRIGQVKESYMTALMLIRDMLQSDPELLNYSPITPPANMGEKTLNVLTLGAFLFRQNLEEATRAA